MTTEPKILAISHIDRPYANPTKDSATGRQAIGVPVAVIPDGQQMISLRPFFDEWRNKPERRKGTVKLREESFIDYVKRYRNPETTVMYVRRVLWWWRVTVIFNAAPAGPVDSDTGFGDFRAVTWTRDYVRVAMELNMKGWVLCWR